MDLNAAATPQTARRLDPDLDLVLFRNLLSQSPDILYFKDLDGRYLRLSRGAAEALVGGGAAMPLGSTDFDHYHAAHAQRAFEQEQTIIHTGEPLVDVVEHQRWPDRDDTWISTTKLPLRDDKGRVIGTFGVSRDITARVMAERAAASAAAQLALILDASPDAIVRVDQDLTVTYVNPAAAALADQARKRLIGKPLLRLGGEGSLDDWEQALRDVVTTGVSRETEVVLPRRDGPMWLHIRIVAERDIHGAITGAISTSRDVTSLKLAEQLLQHRATHDPLTGLPNRVLLDDRLQEAMFNLSRSTGILVLIFVDLDNFKAVNDRYGHAAGDEVLVESARRMEACARRSDTVARLGGDEFVLMCEGLRDERDVAPLLARLRRELSRPFAAAPDVPVAASVGWTVATDADVSPEGLLHRADASMYEHKQRRHGGAPTSGAESARGR